MRKNYFLFLFIAGYFMVSCSTSGNSDKIIKSVEAVCIWDNAPLREAPGKNGRWLSGLSIGETVRYMKEEQIDSTEQKHIHYIKIQLKDGKEGWAQSDFVVINSKAATLKENAEMYSRPDLLNKSGKVFSQMDIIAVKSEKDGFIEVTGRRKGARWMESGWLRSNVVSYEDVDIAVAKFASKALEIADQNKREEAIMEIVSNSDFSSSVFIPMLKIEEKEVESVNYETAEDLYLDSDDDLI
jgi:hypothetical protein